MPKTPAPHRPAHTLSVPEQMLIEQQVANRTQSVLVAYLFWVFLGLLSGHRFYLGRPMTACTQVLLNLLLIGLLWTLFDLVLIPGMIRKNQDRLRVELAAEMHYQNELRQYHATHGTSAT